MIYWDHGPTFPEFLYRVYPTPGTARPHVVSGSLKGQVSRDEYLKKWTSLSLHPLLPLLVIIVFKIAAFCTDKKENQIFLIYKEIQNRAVGKSYID